MPQRSLFATRDVSGASGWLPDLAFKFPAAFHIDSIQQRYNIYLFWFTTTFCKLALMLFLYFYGK